MRLEHKEPTNESGLYAGLRDRTGLYFYYERVESSNEKGFPDIHFVIRDNFCSVGTQNEGSLELKYDRAAKMSLRKLLRGTQKTALLDYFEAGGRRRFALNYWQGNLYLWNTPDFRREVLGSPGETFTAHRRWNLVGESPHELALWLSENGLEGRDG